MATGGNRGEPTQTTNPMKGLDRRARDVLRHVVDAFVETGGPVGSRSISRHMSLSLSPATIRNVMADLEDAGLLYAPHTSAGRLPTDAGLRLFVDGILQVGELSDTERRSIESSCRIENRNVQRVLEAATDTMSGLAACAGLVVAPKSDAPLKHIEFVNLAPGRALVVLVTGDNQVENRVIEVPVGLPPSSLVEATNFLSAQLVGRTLSEARTAIEQELSTQRAELDALTKRVVAAGLASWTDDGSDDGLLIVRGQSNLLADVSAAEDLTRIRTLFSALERKRTMLQLIDSAGSADGVQIFIGAESDLFDHTGCSLVIAPFRDSQEKVVGAVGVIGPTRINYARIIPVVDYTAQVIGRMLPGSGISAADQVDS